jgi:glyoxylase-like metal-dependent hydrolase (beta-lactamase superfamily II)
VVEADSPASAPSRESTPTRWRIGRITIDRVVESERPVLAASAIFPAATEQALASHRAWLEPRLLDPATGLLVLSFHSFVVRTPRRTIVVDTCGGNDKPRPQKARYHLQRWPYLERLAAAGVRPEDVDLVVCTHLHVDHVGWNTRLIDGSWIPTFPRARYLFARPEWDFWREEYKFVRFTDDRYYEDSIRPVFDAGQVDLVDGEHALDAGVWLEPTPGHTPGSVCVRVSDGGDEAIMIGDLMHHPLQCAEPDWSSCFALIRSTRAGRDAPSSCAMPTGKRS